MQLSPHFTLAELTRSDAAARLKLSNQPTREHLANLRLLAAGLEEAREILGVPLIVTSAYRNPEVNEEVGGVPTSDHARGYAADFRAKGMTIYAAARALAESGRLRFDQLIYEPGRCVHLSIAPRMRGEILTQRRLRGPCVRGIVK